MTLVEEMRFAEQRLEGARYELQIARIEGDEAGTVESRHRYDCLEEMMNVIAKHMTDDERKQYFLGTTLSLDGVCVLA